MSALSRGGTLIAFCCDEVWLSAADELSSFEKLLLTAEEDVASEDESDEPPEVFEVVVPFDEEDAEEAAFEDAVLDAAVLEAAEGLLEEDAFELDDELELVFEPDEDEDDIFSLSLFKSVSVTEDFTSLLLLLSLSTADTVLSVSDESVIVLSDGAAVLSAQPARITPERSAAKMIFFPAFFMWHYLVFCMISKRILFFVYQNVF